MKLIDSDLVKYVIGKYEVPEAFDHKYCSTWIKEAKEMNDRFAKEFEKAQKEMGVYRYRYRFYQARQRTAEFAVSRL